MMVFSTKNRKLKKVRAVILKIIVLLVNAGKPDTLPRDISGMQGHIILIQVFVLVKAKKRCLPPSGLWSYR